MQGKEGVDQANEAHTRVLVGKDTTYALSLRSISLSSLPFLLVNPFLTMSELKFLWTWSIKRVKREFLCSLA